MRSAGDVGTELGQLAQNPAYRNLTNLGQLADDLKSGDLARWRRVDVLALCDDESVLSEHQLRARAVSLIDLIRNLFLFLPLLITWGGIYYAVRAYRLLLDAPAAELKQFEGVTFLQMWTSGFGGRTRMTLDLVALLDFLAIMMIIVLFVGGTALQRQVEAERQRNIVRLRSRLIEVTTVVSVADEAVVDRLIASTQELLEICEDTVRQLLTAQKELADSVDGGRRSMAELARTTKELARSGTAIARSADRLNAPAETLARTVQTVATATDALVANTGTITSQLPAVRQGLQDLQTGVRDLSGELRGLYARHIEAMKEQVPIYQESIVRLVATQKELVESIASGKDNITDLAVATTRLATTGDIIARGAHDMREHVEALAASTERFDRTVTSLVAGTGDLTTHLPTLKQGILDVFAGISSVGGKLDDLYGRQEVIAQELGVLADNPLAAAEAAKRTAAAARDTEAALLKAITALPGQMDRLREAVVAALDREIQERHAAAHALADSSEVTRKTIETALGTLLTSSVEASDTLRRAVEQLRESPRHILPDLHDVSAQLAETLDRSRVLVETLIQSAESDGHPTGAKWWPFSSRRGSQVGA